MLYMYAYQRGRKSNQSVCGGDKLPFNGGGGGGGGGSCPPCSSIYAPAYNIHNDALDYKIMLVHDSALHIRKQ